MEIVLSRPARRYLASHGGEVFIYFESVGQSEWMVQRVKLRRPSGRDLSLHELDGLRIWLDATFDPPSKLEIQRTFWQFGPLQVTGTGDGQAVGAYEGDGGSWPTHGHHGGGGDGGGHAGHGGH